MNKAIPKSRIRLENAHNTLDESAYSTYRDALDLLHAYYVKQPNVPRVAASLILAFSGLICAFFGVRLVSLKLNIAAYVIYLLSVVCVEGGVAFYWRAKLYSRIRPLAAAKYEL